VKLANVLPVNGKNAQDRVKSTYPANSCVENLLGPHLFRIVSARLTPRLSFGPIIANGREKGRGRL